MRDPKLWMVRLNKSGTERQEVIAILNKCFLHAKQGVDLQIYSVFASDDSK
ncbi:supt5h protein, putative, partial [Eimeria tenella]